jgi:osmotically-inducible protein OsmY
MRSDIDIKRDVEAELRWSPDVDETDIAVKVHGGQVTLSGYVRNYFDTFRAEVAAKRVKGVAAVANDIEVRPFASAPADPEVARAALAALKTELPLSWENIRLVVHQGRVTLDGIVDWQYQRERAGSAVQHVNGVLGVINSLRIEPKIAPENIKKKIEAAFQRLAHVDAGHIAVETSGSEVTLRGEVRSWTERDQAQQTAWSAPGVAKVVNELTVRT